MPSDRRRLVEVQVLGLPDCSTSLGAVGPRAVVEPEIVPKLVNEGRIEIVGIQVEDESRLPHKAEAGPRAPLAFGKDDAIELKVLARRLWVRACGLVVPGHAHWRQDCRGNLELAPRGLVEVLVRVVQNAAHISLDIASVLTLDGVLVESLVALLFAHITWASGDNEHRLGADRIEMIDTKGSGRRRSNDSRTCEELLVRLEHEAAVEHEATHLHLVDGDDLPRLECEELVKRVSHGSIEQLDGERSIREREEVCVTLVGRVEGARERQLCLALEAEGEGCGVCKAALGDERAQRG
eukprot:scaffold36265_cov26-Tisochrysis_lutea.AAC.1